MKKVEENRYPNSATLFSFCKKALEMRYDGNVKVIDQDVGAILGYDPADCSHWKKGKKNIRSLSILRSIADHLSIDDRLLIDIASGKVNLDEAIHEYNGYGQFELNSKSLDGLKKEFFKNPVKWQGNDLSATFEQLFDVNRPGLVNVVETLINKGTFTETPIYVPELINLFSGVTLASDPELASEVLIKNDDNDGHKLQIVFRGPEMRPYVRFAIARELFFHLIRTKNDLVAQLSAAPAEVRGIQANLFASMILVPGALLRREVENTDSAKDIVVQLAESFWVSKALMNQRLRDYLENRS